MKSKTVKSILTALSGFLSKISLRLSRFFHTLSFRQVTSSVLVSVILLYTGFEFVNYQAFQKFAKFDFNLRKVGGLIVFAERKSLQVGQNLSRDEVIKHLERIDYTKASQDSTSKAEDGTYLLIGRNGLQIIPRFPEDVPVYITFSKNGIEKLYKWSNQQSIALIKSGEINEWIPVQQVFIQPEELQTSIIEFEQNTEQPNALSEMNVRRSIASQSDVMDSYFLDCVKAIEDERFEEHNGIDYWALLRIPYYKITQPGRKTLGASTVEMQVMRNTVLNSKERSGFAGLMRKMQEIVLASNFKYHLSTEQSSEHSEIKAKILTLYANSCFLGQRRGNPIVYGYLTAAETYFNKKSIKDLTLAEMMTLVSMNHGPGKYVSARSLNVNYALLKKRRDHHLDRLLDILPEKYGRDEIARAKAESIKFIDPILSIRQRELDVISSPFVNFALNHPSLELIKKDSPEKYSHLNVYSTTDADLTRSAENILKNWLPKISKMFPAVDKTCRVNSNNAAPGKENKLLATIVAMDRSTGEMLTFYGGELGSAGYHHSAIALNSMVQPASVYKSFVLAEALDKGKFESGEPFTALTKIPPKNIAIRSLIKKSDNDSPRWLCRLDELKGDCGIKLLSVLTDNKISPISPLEVPVGLSGGQELSPLKLTESFNIFANEGRLVRAKPFSALYVDGNPESGEMLPASAEAKVIDEDVAFMTADILRDVIRDGTASDAFKSTGIPSDLEIFGKSGSGESFTLFVGSTPRLTISVVLNYECPTKVKPFKIKKGDPVELKASYSATLIWMDFLSEIQKYRPNLLMGDFIQPANVIKVPVNRELGCRSLNGNDMEVFRRGTEPSPCPQSK